MALRKVADAVVYRDERYYCGPGPSVVVFPDGEVTVFFRRHRSWPVSPLLLHAHPMTEQCCVGSFDGGATWESLPRVFAAGGNCPCVSLVTDGVLLLARHRMEAALKCLLDGDTQTYEADRHKGDWQLVFAGAEVWRSEDLGERWEGPFWIDDVPDLEPAHDGLHAPLGIRGFIVELRDGTLALPVYAEGVGSILVVSSDGGRNWEYRGHAARCPEGQAGWSYNEWVLHETPSGDLVAFIRSQLPGDRSGYLHTARSSDGGRSWSEPECQPVWGYPHHVLPMLSGRLLLSYGYRREPYGLRCCLIDAECERIGETDELVLRDDGGHWDLGYPHAALLPDGRALIVYYFCDRPDGQRYIAASIVEEG
jgi:sialidase-1